MKYGNFEISYPAPILWYKLPAKVAFCVIVWYWAAVTVRQDAKTLGAIRQEALICAFRHAALTFQTRGKWARMIHDVVTWLRSKYRGTEGGWNTWTKGLFLGSCGPHGTRCGEDAPVYYGPVWWGSNLQILQDGDWNSAAYCLLLRGVGSSAL
jgi:hypothetical protein